MRTPLRPLARILKARETGENPDMIEAENRARRHAATQDKARSRAEGRLLLLGLMFFCAFVVIGGRMGTLASSVPEEPRAAAEGNPSHRAHLGGRKLQAQREQEELDAQLGQGLDLDQLLHQAEAARADGGPR